MGGASVRVLVVDDNPDSLGLAKDILKVAGYQVITASDGPNALKAARAELPDLILLDVNMPGMSGMEVCAEIKKDERTAQMPVIMLSALGDIDNRVDALAMGADDFLAKPYSPRELMARVERRLRAKMVTDDLLEKQRVIRDTFERFVAAPIVQQMLQNPDSVKLGGTLQQVTVLFADIEGFTPLSESSEDPVELLRVLNEYHSLIVKIIQQYHGTIDKFIGDGVMALYNTPLQYEHHVADAVKTALHIQNALTWFHERFEPQYRLQINFGIHTGPAVVGNVGANDLMDFTAIGDTVNIASRLQGCSERGQILVSEAVYEQVKHFARGRSMGPIAVKGRTKPVMTYQLSDILPE